MEELNKWYDDLMWCPSQCYYYFMHEGDLYCIYLRWRHDDPWTAEIIKCADGDFDLNYETCIWKYIKVPFFKDDELDKLKEYIMTRLNIIMTLWPHYEREVSLKLEDLKMLPQDIRQQVQTMWLELWEQPNCRKTPSCELK